MLTRFYISLGIAALFLLSACQSAGPEPKKHCYSSENKFGQSALFQAEIDSLCAEAISLNDTSRLVRAECLRIDYFLQNGQVTEADSVVQYLKSMLQGTTTDINRARLLLSQGKIKDHLTNYEEALVFYDIARPLFDEMGCASDMAEVYYEISNTHVNLANWQNAAAYADSCLSVAKKHGFESEIVRSIINLGYANMYEGNFAEAAAFLQENEAKLLQSDFHFLQTNNYLALGFLQYEESNADSAGYYFDKAHLTSIEAGFHLPKVHVGYTKYGVAFGPEEVYNSIDSLLALESLCSRTGNWRFSAAIDRQIGYLHYRADDDSSAYRYYVKSLNTAIEHDVISEATVSCFYLDQSFKYLGQLDSAYRYASFRSDLTESKKDNRRDLISELNNQYVVDRQNLEHAQETLIQKQKFNLTVLIAVFIIILFLLVFFVVRSRYEQRLKQERSRNKHELLELNQELLNSHFGGHFFLNTAQRAVVMVTKDTNKTQKYLVDVCGFLNDLLSTHSNHFSIDLAQELRLVNDYLAVERMSNSTQLSLSTEIDEAIDINHVQVLPMCLQPFVENALKHGKQGLEKEILISVHRHDDQIRIRILDLGNHPSEDSPTSSFGGHGNEINEQRIKIYNELQGNKKHHFHSSDSSQGWHVEFDLAYYEED